MVRVGKILFGLGATMLFVYGMWFFILYGLVDPEAYQMMDISQGIQNRTRDVTIIYQFEFHEPITIIEESNDERTAAIDVSGIVTGVTVGGILIIISKIIDKRWPKIEK